MNHNKKAKTLLILMLSLTLNGCSTTSSVGTGAGVGAAMGAGVGAIADAGPNGQNRFRNVVIGAAAGSVLGMGAGFALDRNNRDQREDAKKDGMKEAVDEMNRRANSAVTGNEPRLVPPKTEAKWIPDQVKGSTFVPGHFEYLIVSPAHWEGN